MSVIVKGMEMPNNCAHCLCGDESGRYCAAANKYIPMLSKPKWCPLVEVPTPHGRLVDADELKTAFPRCDNNMNVKIVCVRATINHMDTIVDAEDSE